MNVPPRKRKLYTILSVILLLAIPLGVFGVKTYLDWRSRASASPTPEDVRISDLTTTSVVVSWVTPDTSAEGWVKYSTSSTLGSDAQVAQDSRDVSGGKTVKRKTHYVVVSGLDAGTTYYFSVGSGSQEFKDESNNPFSFTTAEFSSAATTPSPDPVYGTVENGQDQSAIVYVTLGSGSNLSFPVSTLTNDSGNFEVDLSHVKTSSLSGSYPYDDNTQMNIYAQGADKGGAIVETTVGVTSAIEMTMDENVSTTKIFSDSSQVGIDNGKEDTSDYEPINEASDMAGDLKEEEDSSEVTLTSMGLSDVIYDTEDIEDVQITNVTENSFSVVWGSDEKEEGYVIYGISSDTLASTAIDDRDSLTSKGLYYMHHVTLDDLKPETTYYFKVSSGGILYDNSGVPYSLTTPATQSTPPTSFTVTGVVTGTGKSDSVILMRVATDLSESALLSISTDLDGEWVIDLGSVRTVDYGEYFSYETSDDIVITGITVGDSSTSTHVISDTEGKVLGIELNVKVGSSGISELPETAINGIAAVALTFSVMLIIYGMVILGNYYRDEKRTNWERDFLREIEK